MSRMITKRKAGETLRFEIDDAIIEVDIMKISPAVVRLLIHAPRSVVFDVMPTPPRMEKSDE